MRESLEFAVVWTLVKLLGAMPRSWARALGSAVGVVAYTLLDRLRKVGLTNLALAFPEKSVAECEQTLRRLYRNLGWLLAEFCQMPRYNPENTRSFACYEGLDHYLAARDRGKGVLILTGHLGAWELSSYYHSLKGHPMSMVIRRLDNARVPAFPRPTRRRSRHMRRLRLTGPLGPMGRRRVAKAEGSKVDLIASRALVHMTGAPHFRANLSGAPRWLDPNFGSSAEIARAGYRDSAGILLVSAPRLL